MCIYSIKISCTPPSIFWMNAFWTRTVCWRSNYTVCFVLRYKPMHPILCTTRFWNYTWMMLLTRKMSRLVRTNSKVVSWICFSSVIPAHKRTSTFVVSTCIWFGYTLIYFSQPSNKSLRSTARQAKSSFPSTATWNAPAKPETYYIRLVFSSTVSVVSLFEVFVWTVLLW